MMMMTTRPRWGSWRGCVVSSFNWRQLKLLGTMVIVAGDDFASQFVRDKKLLCG
jgi:hypothetical protein